MKKLVLSLCLVALALSASSQTKLRLNALAWAGVMPNIGIETGISKHITFVAEGYYSPLWNTDGFRAKGFMITPEFRYYFCEKFDKHYIGIHGNYTKYDPLQITSNQHIRKGDAYMVGLTYGHQWIFNHHWSFDLFGGLAWGWFKNDIYSRCEPDFPVKKNARETKIVPSRIGATFAYTF